MTLKNDNGTVTSPEYPENYGNDVVQRVHIEAKPGHVITLKFYTFDVEDADEGGARTDFVRVNATFYKNNLTNSFTKKK